MKFYLSLILMTLALVSLASAAELGTVAAGDLIDSVKPINPFGVEKQIYEPLLTDKVKEYPTIALEDNIMWIGAGRLSDYKIDKIECGITKCAMKMIVNIYEKGAAFDSEIKSIDLKDNKNKNLPLQYYIRGEDIIETVDVKDYSADACTILDYTNKDNKKICGKTYLGTHKETVIKESWTPYNYEELEPGSYEIELRGEIKPGQTVDVIPYARGIEFSEWAVWSSSLEIGLKAFYQLNDSSGLIAYNAIGDKSKQMGLAGTTGNWTTGKIGNGLAMNKSARIRNDSITDLFKSTGAAINFWVYQSNPATATQQHYEFNDGTNNLYTYFTSATNLRIANYNGAAEISVDFDYTNYFNKWVMITVNYNATAVEVYINGTRIGQGAGTVNIPVSYGTSATLGNDRTSSRGINGIIDEIALYNKTINASVVSDLYNNFVGLTWTNLTVGSDTTASIYPALLTPANAVNYNSGNNINFSANANISNGNLTNMTLYIFGATTITNFTSVTGSFNISNWTHTLSDYNYKWNVYACGVNATATVCGFNATNRTFNVDTSAPYVKINTPTNNQQYANIFNITLNFTASDAVSNLSSCWYNIDNGANISLYSQCNGLSSTTNITTFISAFGSHTINFYSNDSYNFVNFTSVNYSINNFTDSVSYSPTVLQLENTTITLTVNSNNISSISANITYNGTFSNMTQISNNGTVAVFSITEIAPVVSSQQNITFIIMYNLNNIATTTLTNQQTIFTLPPLNVTAGLCSGTPIFWFTLRDEESDAVLNSGVFDYNFNYGLSNSSASTVYGRISGTSNFSVCANFSISPYWIIGSGEIAYSNDTNYVDRRYYIFDETNVTGASNITLYSLTSAVQTSFKLEIEDTSLNPYDNVYARLLRWYPDSNAYKIVDMGKTDEKGSTVIHVRTEDIDYRIGVYYRNGTLIYLANPIRMVCLLSPCTYTLSISPSDSDYTSFLNVVYTFNYNETSGIWTFVYSDTTGATSTMNLTVWKDTATSSYPICSSTVSGAVGSITCNTSGYTGLLRGEVYRAASPPVIIVQKIYSAISSAFRGSTFGLFLSLLIAIPIIFLLAVVSPIAAIIGGVISLIPALYLGSINIGIVGGFAVLGGIVAHFLKRVS